MASIKAICIDRPSASRKNLAADFSTRGNPIGLVSKGWCFAPLRVAGGEADEMFGLAEALAT
jgi:hypothetical protein